MVTDKALFGGCFCWYLNGPEGSLFFQMLNSIRDCFVTGKWDESQDAATLLKEDGERGEPNTWISM